MSDALCEDCGKPHLVETKRGKCDACGVVLVRMADGQYEPDEDQTDYNASPTCSECGGESSGHGRLCDYCCQQDAVAEKADRAYDDARLGL